MPATEVGMTTNDIGRLEKRGSTSLRRAASDVYGSSQYKTTASIQLQKTPAEAEDTVKGNSAALKAFHTERLKSALDFFRKKEEFNQSSKGTSPSRGRPLSLHASFSYDHHGNNLNASSSYQNGTTLAKFGNIVQRSSEPPESCKNRQPVDSTDDKTPTEKNTSSSQFRRMNASHSTTACKAGTNMNSVKTGVNPEANMKGRTNCVKVQVENDDSGFIGGLPTLEKLKRDIETYDKELHECDDYDKRRAFRAKIRDLRKQIKEEKYYKQEATSSASSDDILLATNLPHAYITGAVQSSKAATSSRAHPIIIEEPVSTDKANNIPETSTHRKLAVTNRGRHPAETNKYKKVDNDKDVTPQVIHKLEDQAVLDGQSCSFKCNISAPEGATIVWYHDSKLLESSDEIRQQFANGNAKLNIAEVFPDDEGVYKCVVTCTAGTAETTARLTVLGENDCEMPEISVPLENQTCSEGDTITLTCSVCGKPKPLITWSRDGYPLFGAKRYIYKYDGQEAVLVINDAITGDGGSYTCEARSLAGSASSECIIDVKASPVKKPEFLVVLPSTHSVNQGRNLTLTCHVMGKPRPDVTWYHEARELTQCEQYAMNYEGDCVKLTLRNTTAGMAGSYSCLASNSSGDIRCITTVNVTGRTIEPGKPVFINPLSDVLVPDGTPSFTLKCSIEGRPRPVVLWQKGRDFLRTGSRYREKFDGREASLEIKQVNKSDTDSYTCVCRNEFGKVKSTCALTVQDSDKVLTAATKMSGKPDINSINDEDELYKLMNATDDFEERKKIRARMREIREAKAGSDILRKAEDEQQKKLKELNEEGVSRTTKTEKSSDGGTTVTSTTVTTHKTKDGSSTSVKQTKQITQISGIGGTSYAISRTSAASKPTGPRGARAAFQQMDKATAPPAGSKPNFLGGAGGGRVTVQRSPSTIKQMLLDWCKSVTKEYEPKVCITNFSSSWNNGLAFCALIHHFYPDAFNFDELDPKKRRYNFNLAFDTAEKLADIAPLLDVEDMVRMKNPDWKCVFTYVQSFYRRFRSSPSTPTTPVTPISPEPQTN